MSEGGMTEQASWAPANDVEQAMLAALAVDDSQAFFEVIATAPLYLPAGAGQPAGNVPARFTMRVGEHTYLPVFTSLGALAAALGNQVERYVLTSYLELGLHWPEPEWRLAVNPGLPIDAWLPVEAVAEAADGTRTVPTVKELTRTPAEQEEAEADAALDEYLAVLVLVDVIVPAAAPGPDPAAVAAGTFPWLVTQVSGQPTISVFTEPEGFAAAYPAGTPFVRVPFAEVVVGWPAPAWQLVVDPGADVGLTLPGDQVAGLLLWTDEDIEVEDPDQEEPTQFRSGSP